MNKSDPVRICYGKLVFTLFFMILIFQGKRVQSQTRDICISYSIPVKAGKHYSSAFSNTGINVDLTFNDSTLNLRVNRLGRLSLIRRIVFYYLRSGDFNSKKLHFKKITGLGRKRIMKNLKYQEDRITSDLTKWRFTADHNVDTTVLKNKYKADFDRFLRGKATNQFAILWLNPGHIIVDKSESVNNFRVRISLRRRKDIYVYPDTVPCEAFKRLPQVDSGFCQRVNRFFDFKKLKGYGYENIKPLHYIPSKRKVFTRDFEVLFERNSVQVNPELLEPIIRFLENNHYSILNATVKGYASVEGPEENNYRLQHKRAELMIRILQEHNADEITLDTVIAAENWDMFSKQIKGTPYEYLDSISRDSLRQLLMDSLLLVRIEPMLKKERKAVLDLTLADIFSAGKINENILDDIRNLSHYVYSPFTENISKINLNKMAGILFTLENRVRSNTISRESAEAALRGINNPLTWVMYFYLAIGQYETSGKLPALFSWKEIFRNAQSGIINLINSLDNTSFRNMFIRQAVDIQYYAFRFVEENIIDRGFIHEIQYPDEPVFYPLILTRYAYLNNNVPTDDISGPGPGYGFNAARLRYYPHYKNVPEKLQSPPSSLFISNLPGKWYINPQYNTYYQSAYYYFLKKVFVYGDKDIKQYVWQSDNLYEFDLFELLWRNIENWDPVKNSFYDGDINQDVMSVLVQDLQAIDKRICPMAKNQLYLDFYLKYLYYYKLYGSPYDREQQFTVQQAIRYISDYYMARISFLTPAQVLAVVKQMNLFYGLPGPQNSTLRSYRLLREYVKSGTAPWETIRLYLLMASFYESDMESVLTRQAHDISDICSVFRGKYHIKPWREDVRTYFKQNCIKEGTDQVNHTK